MGIEVEKFVSLVDDDFICMICTFVLDNPVRISGCEHMFCRECISNWIKQSATCPVNRNPIGDSDLIAPNRTAINILNKLEIKCEFDSIGCEVVVQFEVWRNHSKKCEFNPDNKQPCVGCGMLLLKRDAENHKCLEKFEFENMKLKQEINEMKYLLSDHQSTNEKLELQVQKLKQEIDQQNNLLTQLVDKIEENQETIKRLENQNKSLLSENEALKNENQPTASKRINNCSQNQDLEAKITGSSIDKWFFLSSLPADLKSRVKLASVFGADQMYEAIVITKGDEVFWVKADKETFRTNNKVKPIKIKSLSKQKIQTLVFNCYFKYESLVFALTRDNKLLSWSNGKHPLLEEMDNKSTEMSCFIGKKIVQVACGSLYALALSEDGEVWAWGMNGLGQLGTGQSVDNFKPVKVTKEIGTRRTLAVACLIATSFAVMDNGEVYSWGWNNCGQLGIADEVAEITVPTKVKALKDVRIRRLVGGVTHVLAVAEDGSMFSWGDNKVGQLGTGDTINRNHPIKIGPDDVKFIDVATCFFTSVALCDDGRSWVWGYCRNEIGSNNFKNVLFPKPVESASIHDAIADYANYPSTWKTIVFD